MQTKMVHCEAATVLQYNIALFGRFTVAEILDRKEPL